MKSVAKGKPPTGSSRINTISTDSHRATGLSKYCEQTSMACVPDESLNASTGTPIMSQDLNQLLNNEILMAPNQANESQHPSPPL